MPSVSSSTNIPNENPFSSINLNTKEGYLQAFEIIKNNGLALYYAPELKNDRWVVLAAVRENGEAIRFASNLLKKDPGIAFAAMEKTPSAFKWIDSTLRGQKEIVHFAATYDAKTTKENADPKVLADQDIVATLAQSVLRKKNQIK